MSKKRSKQNKANDESVSANEDAVSEDAVDSAETVASAADNDNHPQIAEAVGVDAASSEASEQSKDLQKFGDAGTEFIEGYLREELGLDGDLTDDEFALAALDFLGDENDGGTVFFDPDQLGEMAAQEHKTMAESDDFDDDAFAKSIEELEEAISAVSDPAFQKEGTVMMSLPESVREEVAAILADEEAAEAEAAEAAAAEAAATEAAISEAEVEATEDEQAVFESADEAQEAVEQQPVEEQPFVEAELVAEADEAAIAAVVDEAVAEAVETDQPVAEESESIVSAEEQAEVDEAMRELLEIQAMLESDGDGAEANADAVADADELAEVDQQSAESDAPEPVADEIVAEQADDASAAVSELFEDDELTAEEQALLDEMIAEEAAASGRAGASPSPNPQPEEPTSGRAGASPSPTPQPEEPVDEEEAAIVAMMAELEGMNLDNIDFDNLDLEGLSAEDALNELTALVNDDDSSDLEAAFAELEGVSDRQSAEEMVAIEPEQYEETSDYLDTLVAALDEAVADIGLTESSTLELVASDERRAENFEQLIVFRIGDSDYAVPIDNVIEVGEPISATAVPFVPQWVRGVINLRGEIISLIDLRDYFEVSENRATKDEWMIVAQNQDASMVVGLIVDDVRGNRQFADTDLAELTAELDDPSTKYLRRIYQQEEGLVVALDFDKLLNSADMRQFEPI